MKKTTKKNIDINEASKHLFEVLDKSAELRLSRTGNLVYKGHIIPQDQKNRIVSEAKTILDLELWSILMDDMKQVACRKMYEEDVDGELRKGGKWMLYFVDVLNKKLYNLSNLKK